MFVFLSVSPSVPPRSGIAAKRLKVLSKFFTARPTDSLIILTTVSNQLTNGYVELKNFSRVTPEPRFKGTRVGHSEGREGGREGEGIKGKTEGEEKLVSPTY